MSQKTVTINGTTYDARTGLPVSEATKPAPAAASVKPAARKAHHSHDVHTRAQKSHTLNRRVVKKATASSAKPAATKSPMITRFAPHPTNAQKKRVVSDIAPTVHPIAQKAHKKMAAKPSTHATPTHHAAKPAAKTAPKPAAVIKNEAISEALAKAPSHHAKAKQHKGPSKTPRILSVATASLALLLLGGYFTYLNMPNLSVRVAAAQAGIDASYPSYRPDGYSLRGPVAYNQGEVSMKFAANAGPQNFTITQSKSSFDSSAVEENYVKPKWGENSMKQIERGITIYAHDGNAVWVNDGILYEIQGDAPLSSSQIRGIATSL